MAYFSVCSSKADQERRTFKSEIAGLKTALADQRKKIICLKNHIKRQIDKVEKPGGLTYTQKRQYYTIVGSANEFGVKRDQITPFALGVMNTLFPNINEKDSTELFNEIKHMESERHTNPKVSLTKKWSIKL